MLRGVDALELGTGDADVPDEPVVSLRQVDVDAERLVSVREGERYGSLGATGVDSVTARSRV